MKFFIYMASLAASVPAMYSASVEERLTVCCRFDDQDIGPPASINTHPVVDLDVSEQPP